MRERSLAQFRKVGGKSRATAHRIRQRVAPSAVSWMITPPGRRHWAAAEPGGPAELVVRLDEETKGTLLLRNRAGGKDRRYPANDPAVLGVEDGLGEAVWDAYVVDALGRTRRIQADWVDPMAACSVSTTNRLVALVPYRTVLGGLSIRTHDRAQHFELDEVRAEAGEVLLAGTLTTPSNDQPEAIELEGLGGNLGRNSTVTVNMVLLADGLQLRVPLEAVRLAEKAATTAFRPWIVTDRGTRIDIGALGTGAQQVRRLRAGITVGVDDPDAETDLVEESPDPGRTVRVYVDVDGSARIEISHRLPEGSA